MNGPSEMLTVIFYVLMVVVVVILVISIFLLRNEIEQLGFDHHQTRRLIDRLTRDLRNQDREIQYLKNNSGTEKGEEYLMGNMWLVEGVGSINRGDEALYDVKLVSRHGEEAITVVIGRDKYDFVYQALFTQTPIRLSDIVEITFKEIEEEWD